MMNAEFRAPRDICERSYRFALLIIRIVRKLPRDVAGRAVGEQLVRAGPGVGANVEEAQGALTHRDFTHSMNVAKKEARESHYWLRLIGDSGLLDDPDVEAGRREADELTRILTSIVKKAQGPAVQVGPTAPRRHSRAGDRHS